MRSCKYVLTIGLAQCLLANKIVPPCPQIRPQEHKILLTEPPENPVENRRNLIQTMFETYEYGALNISIQAMLTLYAQVISMLNILLNLWPYPCSSGSVDWSCGRHR
jgi:actin-related protein